MSSIGHVIPRTTMLLSSSRLLAALQRTQHDLLTAQTQISTGLQVGKPSDAPDKTAAILLLQGQLQARGQYERNLDHALGVLTNADQGLGDVADLLIEAKSIASSQIGVGSNADTRANQAAVIDAQIQSLIDIANRSFQGVSLFGGRTGSTENDPRVFVPFLGGIRYVGNTQNLAGDVGLGEPLAFNTNGQDAFRALSSRVVGKVNLDPSAVAATHIDDVNGAQALGVRRGSVVVNIDGTQVTVDLNDADTLGDVATRINAAIDSVDPAAGALGVSANGFTLTAAAGHTITISELAGGQTAADLGIDVTASGAAVVGGDIDPRLTLLTPTSALGGVDLTSGLRITQGGTTKVADFSSAATIQDMINVVNNLSLGVRLEINAAGSGLNFFSDVSGIDLSVGENGGTTADDLGIRTFSASTLLADLRHGLGIDNSQGTDDFQVGLHNGTTFRVNIDGLTSVGQVVGAIQAAAAAQGLTVGLPGDATSDFNVGLAISGNGLALEDNTAGGSAFDVQQLGTSLAATHLGIYTSAQGGSSIAGEDVGTVRVESVFTHLMQLRDALQQNSSAGITLASTGIEGDIEIVARARADIGVRSQRVEQQQERSATLKITEQSMLSNLRDADVTAAITRFTQLMQQLEASLAAGGQNLQLSLLDFLR